VAPDVAGWTWADMRRHRVLVEDEDVLVLDKPPGLSVMGERHTDDIIDLATRSGEQLYPVHRIDKVTSGVILIAKSLAAHGPLTRQFALRSVAKGYLAVVDGAGLPLHWTVDLPLAVGRKNRVRIAAPRERLTFDEPTARWHVPAEDVLAGKPIYPAVTHVHRLAETAGRTLVVAQPLTGRRHQIRVHLAWTGTPIVGDPLFPAAAGGPPACRAHLHAWTLRIPAALRGGLDLDVTADPDSEFLQPVADSAGASALRAALAGWRDREHLP
jgi:tRNA pseudouridine32 synthase / 23S rRNA pseudouridine746 synthase